MQWEGDGKEKCKGKFLYIMEIGFKPMTVGKGSRLAAISFTCQNEMKEGNGIVQYFWGGKLDLNLISGGKGKGLEIIF